MFIKSCRESEPLSRHATFGIGGPAELFFVATTGEELREAVAWARNTETPFLVIGHGSNCLFPDEGFSGLVIRNAFDEMRVEGKEVYAGSGLSLAKLATSMSSTKLSGLEFGCGIPGTVGGAVIMNAGAHGQSTAEVVRYVDIIDQQGSMQRRQRADVEFGYRSSSLRAEKSIIVGVGFSLSNDPHSVDKQRQMALHRKHTQPVNDRSAGCVFKNPVQDSAGRIIEACGLKGMRVGGACVSNVHANFIVNVGGATASDVLSLVEQIQRIVFERYSIVLERELCVISRDGVLYA